MTKLVRTNARSVHAKPFDECDAELAQQAHELLGYSATVSTMDNGVELLNTLAELDICPFTERSVARYKKAQAWRVYFRNSQALINDIAAWIGIPAVLALVATISWAVTAFFMTSVSAWAQWLPLAIDLALLAVAAVVGRATEGAQRSHPEWTKVSLAHYRLPLPELALQHAVDIAKRMPQRVRLEVETMTANGSHGRAWFLVVTDNHDREYYIDAWHVLLFKDGQSTRRAGKVAEELRRPRGVRIREK